MKICVVGTGYVGLVVGVCMADKGFDVHCVDTNQNKIDQLNAGQVPIYEPGLDEIMHRAVKAGNLRFSIHTHTAIASADIVYIAVGTPSADDGSADLRGVKAVAKAIADSSTGETLAIIKSTVPVGTASMVREICGETVFDVVSNPEFLKEGAAIEDFLKPDRIVVGCQTVQARAWLSKLYKSYENAGVPIHFMNNESAELTKYASNAMLATKISFMNELAQLCEIVGADIDQVREGTGSDSRIGPKFLYSGVGYGGSCFPKDVKALIKMGQQNSMPLQIATAVEEVNLLQKRFLSQKIKNQLGTNLNGKHFAVWGLAFKPETDDIREAPALEIIDDLLNAGATVTAYDPEAAANVHQQIGDKINYAGSPNEALVQADALILVTEWACFRNPNWSEVLTLMRGNRIYDGRNIYSPDEVRHAGLIYEGVGRLRG
ncbi:MAG: UDP-glucose dehydrogenase family protein [Myxococcota bacterium]